MDDESCALSSMKVAGGLLIDEALHDGALCPLRIPWLATSLRKVRELELSLLAPQLTIVRTHSR